MNDETLSRKAPGVQLPQDTLFMSHATNRLPGKPGAATAGTPFTSQYACPEKGAQKFTCISIVDIYSTLPETEVFLRSAY